MTLNVVLKGHSGAQYKEADAAEAITPGHLVALNASGAAIKQTRVGTVPQRVALENHWIGGGLNDAYAINDRVVYQHLQSGAEYQALVAAGAPAIAYGDLLESAGNGTVRKGTGGGSRATVTIGSGNGALTLNARGAGDAGNGITIAVSAASGGGSVTVTNDDIVVVPAAAADTATAVAAQINGNATAAALVTAIAGGTGASPVGTTAATALTGGSDGVGSGGGNMIARQALDNSGGSSAARIRVEIQ
jgi:hypothetical protein